jgi:hypothetical protein
LQEIIEILEGYYKIGLGKLKTPKVFNKAAEEKLVIEALRDATSVVKYKINPKA